jgi:hypothetical protein
MSVQLASVTLAELPGNVDMIIGSAFLPAPAYRQEGGASSRLARDRL